MTRSARPQRPMLRVRARTLRQRGYTYTEICSRLGTIPQGTLAYWFKDVHLNEAQQARIHAKIAASAAKARPFARMAWAKKMQRWRTGIEQRAKPFGFLPYTDPMIGKLVCGIMYICEGGKYPVNQTVYFGNTDPLMIKTFLKLLRRYYHIDEQRLRGRVMHRWDQNGQSLQRYWSRVTKIPLRQFYQSYADKRTRGKPTQKRGYKGVCSIQYGDTNIQYELQSIGNAVLQAKENGKKMEQTGIEPVASTMPLSRSPS